MYANSKEISVEVHNLSCHWNEDNFENFLVDNKIQWIIFQFEYDYQQKFSGQCYITLDKENTSKLLELNGYVSFIFLLLLSSLENTWKKFEYPGR